MGFVGISQVLMELHKILKIKEIYASQHIPTHPNTSQYIPIHPNICFGMYQQYQQLSTVINTSLHVKKKLMKLIIIKYLLLNDPSYPDFIKNPEDN